MMKSTIKRVLAALIASVTVLSFAACGTDGGDNSESQTPPSGTVGGDNGGNNTGNTGGNTGNTGGNTGDTTEPPAPVIPTVPTGSVKITAARGDLEEAYVTWEKVDGAMGYNVYVKNEGENGGYEKLDAPLVREYKDFFRADAVGLKAGTYGFKVVPLGGAELAEDEGKAATASQITVLPHERSGYAFVGGTSSGAYNEDGTLKENATVLYVTNENFKTVSVSYGANTVTGIDNILGEGYQSKNGATNPLCIRIIGSVGNGSKVDFKANGDLELKSLDQGVTIEGIGSDATANGWGMHITKCSNIEIRNLAFMNMMGGTKDGVGFESQCHHVWVHNCDFFYGNNWGGDQKKGDGSLDTKGTTNVTHSYNHFWDSGKCNLQGMKEQGDFRITYHHNWYDHSDSRHPRIRTATVHIYNNYFDGNAKYGVGVTLGASAFVENNYFRSTAPMKPMMSSQQGTDARADKGTFSGENGGIIKSFGNTYDCSASNLKLITQNDTADKTDIDCYEATSRTENVSADYKTKAGGTTYNNFDTASDFYKYEVDSAAVAKEKVEKYAGRVGGGDIEFDFNDAKEDANYDIIPELSALVKNYKSGVIKIGDTATNGDNSGGSTEGGGSSGGNGGSTEGGGSVSGDVNRVDFIASNADKYPAGITVNGNYKNGNYLKMESATKVTVTVSKDTTITVHASLASKKIKLNGTNTILDGNGECSIAIKAGATLTIEKGDSMELMYIILS